MSPSKILFHALRFRLRDLPFELTQTGEETCISVDATQKPLFKLKPLSFESFANKLAPFNLEVSASTVKIPNSFPQEKFKSFLSEIEEMADLVAKENLQNLNIWGSFPNAHSTGFKEGSLPESDSYLKEVYEEKFIVPEKKAFVIDLRRSQRTHLISVDKEPKSFFDAAAQIGSLALGYNDPEKRGIITHEENYEWNPSVFESETYQAYVALLKKLSGMPHVYFFNSGAEANEAALQLCLRKYPKRKRILAFVGSFHGRSLLTLHLTHSPAKRLPFEIYPEIVNFAPFPENKNPQEKIKATPEWTKLWAEVKSPNFDTLLVEFQKKADSLLKAEIDSLLYIKKAFESEEYLSTIIEPRQCEGGDRFATARFYHGLRLLTRAYDTPLLFDEVQTGFGLGGPFFWHEQFELKKADGSADHPDAISFAKKGQVSGVISLLDGPLKHEVSLTSLHRGYIQAMSTLVHEPVNFTYVYNSLKKLQKTLGHNIIQNPRGQAQTFAFDLESPEILNKLLTYRFEEGILFYPAGDRTARFRLLRNFKEKEIDGLFTSLYRCFERAAEDKIIPSIPPLQTWLKSIPESSHGMLSNTPLTRENPWEGFPQTLDQLKQATSEEWQGIFTQLLKQQRNCLLLKSNKEWNLERINTTKLDDLIKTYQNETDFTWLDLLWQASRQQGWKIEKISQLNELKKIKDSIIKIEKDCYEEARQTDYSWFEKCLTEGNGFVLNCNAGSELIGLAACGPIKEFNEKKLLKDDPLKNDPQVFYSIDVTVVPSIVKKGLGLRLKTEQILELTRLGAKAIRSRNRYPEAAAMTRLNHGFGSQVLAQESNVYADGGAAFYQSLRINQKAQKIWDPRHPSMLNKGSLGNFVSPAYIDNLLILKELLPTDYKHIYLASSRGEALDKSIKCLRHIRPKGKVAFSFEGDHFGNTTTSSAELSGETHFFNWPQFKNESDPKLADFIKNTPNESIFGAALSWKNNTEEIKKRIDKMKEYKLPTILNESSSTFWQGSKTNFVLSGTELDPDIFYFGLGPQVAVVACKEAFFNDKPLAMISTWEGDEHGLCLFQDHMLEKMESLK
ncbi:MAG: aminotransferase class III-fold pyridoxal phosphate-dependent enzyme [Bdellovibrionota bacterium]